MSLNEVQQVVEESSRNDDTMFEWNEDLNTQMQRGLRTDEHYDVLVVGGGITGATIAYEAASRGLSVALVEKGDIGGATSAATGKLIYGGLRYLKNFEIGLVRESLRERRLLSNIAPGLVEPFPIVLPEPGCLEHLGLTFYDLLSFDRNRVHDPSHRIPSHRSMTPAELEAHGLGYVKRAILYHDCLMPSPERLTLAFLRSAVAHGAAFLTYVSVVELLVDEGDSYDASRASELVDHARQGVDGIVTAIGAKYTTARALAANTTDHIAKTLGASVSVSRTGEVPLDACAIGPSGDAIELAAAKAAVRVPDVSEWNS